MNAPVAERPRAVTVIGWVWLVVALLRVANGLLGLLVWRVGGLEDGIPLLPPRASQVFRSFGFEAVLRHGGAVFGFQILVASAVALIAVFMLRMRPWARAAMTVVGGLGILATLVLAGGIIVVTREVAREATAEAAKARLAGTAAAIAIGLLGSLGFGATVYFLRRPDVRDAFRTPAS